MLFSSLLFDVHFSGIVFFFCRRGVTSLSSVSTRQTSYSHSKLTHNPKIFTASLSCVWHFLDFVLIKTLVLTCNKRKIILYFVGCSELIFITMFCFHYMHNSLKIFLHLHILPFNPNYWHPSNNSRFWFHVGCLSLYTKMCCSWVFFFKTD